MSGGVDSSAALLLLRGDYELVAATLRLFDTVSTDIQTAKAVAAQFGVQHHLFDFSETFREKVMQRFVDAYISGTTPNPCADCNKHIKFPLLLDRATALGCQYLATGHYAAVEHSAQKRRWLLKKAKHGAADNPKDQSYILYNLKQEQLSRIIFPLGGMSKVSVRDLAEENRLTNSRKPDSQDICFVPDGDYAGFIERFNHTTPVKGNFIDKNGNVLGVHNGIVNYTIGQRRGVGISAANPLYVISKDVKTNTVMLGEEGDLMSDTLIADDLNWIAFENLNETLRTTAKTRYSSREQPCTVTPIGNARVQVTFESPQRALTPGQRVVFYDEDIVLGGGKIILVN